jgi:4-amino-4-deoxy-L-arabinose transferase-like glycosyltransferase
LRHSTAVACLLFLGIVLRAYDLTGQSFSFDETMDVGLARTTSWSEVWRFAAPWHIHPPFHLVVLKTWATLFGWGEWSLRSLSVLLSATVGWLSWRLARELCPVPRVALWSVVFWTVSPLSFFWARNTRSHALFAVLVSLAMLAAWRLANQPTRRNQLAYAGTAFLMIYTLHLGLAFLAVQGFWFMARRCRAGLLAGLGALLLYAPYAGHLLGHLQSRHLVYYQSSSLLDLWAAYEALLCYRFDHADQPWVSLVLVPVLLLGLRRLPLASAFFVVLWLALPTLVWALSQARPAFRFWYFDACLPAVAVVLACGLNSLKARLLGPVALVLGAALHLFVDLDQQRRFRSQDWRGAVATIRRAARPGDVVLMGNAYGYAYWAYNFYAGPLPWFDFNEQPAPSEVPDFFRQHRRVWVLVVNDLTLYFESLVEPGIPTSSRCVLQREFASSNQGSFQLRLYERTGEE